MDPLLSLSMQQAAKNVKRHNWSWRAHLYFLPNVVSGQNLEKLLSHHKALYKVGRISAPIGF